MSSCFIQLDNYQGAFLAGNVIVGRVICSFNTPKNIRGIRIRLKGQERNEWTHTESYYDHVSKTQRTRTIYLTGHNVFLHVNLSLHGGGDFGASTFEYPFTFQLPSNIPSTYQGSYGGVFFTLSAEVDRSYKINFKDKKQIIVVSPINFNNLLGQIQLEPASYSVDKTLCCCCCRSGPITMEVHLEKEAFVVGESINIRVNITNMSNENIESVGVKLKTKVKSMVTYPRSDFRFESELLAATNDTGVGAHGERSYDFRLQIPLNTQVPNFNLCELFSKRNKLKIYATLPGLHNNLKAVTNVALGHIPVYGNSQNPGQYPPNTYPPNIYPPNSYPPNSVLPPYHSEVPGPIGFAMSEEAGASAPPLEGGASAPSKGEKEYVESDDPWSTELPPPSYTEAISDPPKQ